MPNNRYDLMILGAGPAGMTAALFGQRLGLKTIVFGDIPAQEPKWSSDYITLDPGSIDFGDEAVWSVEFDDPDGVHHRIDGIPMLFEYYAMPEPPMLTLLALGLVGAGFFRRKKLD